MPEVAEAPEQSDALPPGEKQHLTRMADSFKAAVKGITKPAPAAIAPVEPPPKPAEPAPKPANPPTPAPTPAPEPAPPEPLKPAATAPPTEPEIPDIPKTHKDWKALKDVKDKFQKDYETLKPQYESLAAEKATLLAEREQAKAALEEAKKGTAAYETLKAEYEQAKKLVDEFYIERSPQFQAHFGQRLKAAKDEAVEVAGEHAEKLKTALEIPASRYRDEQVAAIGSELDDFSRAALVAAYTELKRTEKERAAELAKAPENRKKLAEIEAREQQERMANVTKMRTGFLENITKEVEPDLTGHPEAEAIKAAVRKVIFNEASPQEYTALIADAARWRRHKSSLTEKDELISKLQAQVNELQASSPSLRSNGGAQTKKAPPPMDNSDMGEKFRKARDGKTG